MSVNLNINTNQVFVSSSQNQISVEDKNNGVVLNIEQPINKIIEVTSPGPKGNQGDSIFVKIEDNLFSTTSSLQVTGSLSVSQGITSSLEGTASWAENSISSSFATTSSYALTASFASNYTLTSSFNQLTQSYNEDSSSFDVRVANNSESISNLSSSFTSFSSSYNTGSFTGSFTGSLLGTASNAVSSLYAETASYTPSISGTDNYLAKFNGTSAIENSLIYDDGTNVGIGTTSPAQKLQVEGTIRVGGGYGGSKVEFSGNNVQLGLLGDGQYRQISYLQSSTGTGNTIRTDNYTTTSTAFLAKFQAGTNDRMVIKQTGEVGIGKSTPSATLDVNGNTLITGSLNVTNGITGSLFGTASFAISSSQAQNAQTSSYLNTLNQNLTFNGNLVLNGTASISTLVVNQTQYSSGSNQLGDGIEDTQTLFGTVIVPTGSLTVTGSVTSTQGFTGSLLGTASFAISSSQSENANTASYAPDYVPYIGATQDVDLGENSLSADSLQISTTSAEPIDAGKIVWNSADGTFDMGLLNGVTLQAGQEIHMYAKASGAISNGDAVQFAGAQGDHLLIKKAVPSEITANPEYFVGVATQDFSNNEFGYVTVFGQVRDLDTDAYSEGTVLYFDSMGSTAGLLTDVRPTGPNAKIIVAAVVRSHQNQGSLFVRPHVMPMIGDLQNVEINTGSLATGDILTYNSSSQVWSNTKQLSGSYGLTGSLQATSFTGSLLGNATTATTASYAATSSFTTAVSGTTNYVPKFTASETLGNSQIYDNGTNVGIGTTSPSAKLHLVDTALAGSGALSGSILNLEQTWNTTGTPTAIKLNVTETNSNPNSLLFQLQRNSSNVFTVNKFGNITCNTIAGTGLSVTAGNNATSGVTSAISATRFFQPASGTAVLNNIHSTPSINQTGGANGITRGLYIDPTLTSAADWRSIEWSNNTGRGLYGSGLATNNIQGDIGLGLLTTPSAKLHVRGSGATSTTTALRVENSNSTISMAVLDNGNVGIGTTTPSAKLDVNGTGYFASPITIGGGATLSTAGFSRLGTLQLNGASGNWAGLFINEGVNGNAGSWTYNSLNASPVINQTGTATGITRGLYVNPSLTSVVDFRAIELTNNTGFGIYQSGTANNSFAGNVGIGTTVPNSKLHVYGGNIKIEEGSGGDEKIEVSGGYLAKYNGLDNAWGFAQDNIYIDGSTSSVGIGTTTPSATLDVQGDILIKSVNISNQENLDVDTGTEVVATVAIADYDAAFFDFVIKNGTNLRAGTVYAVHDGTNVEYTETSTSDLGNTSDVTLSVDISSGNMRLLATTTTDNWIIKSLVRAI